MKVSQGLVAEDFKQQGDTFRLHTCKKQNKIQISKFEDLIGFFKQFTHPIQEAKRSSTDLNRSKVFEEKEGI